MVLAKTLLVLAGVTEGSIVTAEDGFACGAASSELNGKSDSETGDAPVISGFIQTLVIVDIRGWMSWEVTNQNHYWYYKMLRCHFGENNVK